MQNWTHVLIHHSASPDHDGLDFDEIRKYHLNVNNWQDIGYHFLMEQADGMVIVVQGRPLTMTGAHSPGMNDKAIGVCVVGNFEITEPSPTIIEALVDRVLVPQCRIWNIPAVNIHGHRDHRKTLCPGEHLYNALPAIRIMVETELAKSK